MKTNFRDIDYKNPYTDVRNACCGDKPFPKEVIVLALLIDEYYRGAELNINTDLRRYYGKIYRPINRKKSNFRLELICRCSSFVDGFNDSINKITNRKKFNKKYNFYRSAFSNSEFNKITNIK